jgi:hypothetical protein
MSVPSLVLFRRSTFTAWRGVVRARVAETGVASDRQRRLARILGTLISIPIALRFWAGHERPAICGDDAPGAP